MELIDSVHIWTIPETELDQALEVLQNMTRVRIQMLLQKMEGTQVQEGSWLSHKSDLDLRQSVEKFTPDELISQISIQERKKLDMLLNALVLWNMWVMAWEHVEALEPFVKKLYSTLELFSWGVVSWDHTIGLMVISVFWYEAFLKIREQWIVPYLKHNKLDVWLNILWAVELGTIINDAITWQTHPGIASVLRWFRSLRILKILGKIPSVKELWLSVKEAMPKTLEFTGIYAVFSWVIMFMMMQILGKHIHEFNNFSDAYSSMRDLFFADGYQTVFLSIKDSQELDGVSKSVASTLANVYMASSSYFYAAVVSGILVDTINKWWHRVEQMMALVLEKVDKIITPIEEIRDTVKKIATKLWV